MISPIEYKDNPLRCPRDRPFACLLSLVIASVEAFPVEGDDQEIEDLASGFSPGLRDTSHYWYSKNGVYRSRLAVYTIY